MRVKSAMCILLVLIFQRASFHEGKGQFVLCVFASIKQGCTGYAGTSDQIRHFEKRLIKENRGANVELGRECLLEEGGCVGARERSRTCL